MSVGGFGRGQEGSGGVKNLFARPMLCSTTSRTCLMLELYISIIVNLPLAGSLTPTPQGTTVVLHSLRNRLSCLEFTQTKT